MTSHYIPYDEHYKPKMLINRLKSGNVVKSIKNRSKRTALIVIDVQNDLLPYGSTPILNKKSDEGVYECKSSINSINELIRSDAFDMYVYTMDIHHKNNKCLASSHDMKIPFEVVDLDIAKYKDTIRQVLWADHCLINDKINDKINDEINDKINAKINDESDDEIDGLISGPNIENRVKNNHNDKGPNLSDMLDVPFDLDIWKRHVLSTRNNTVSNSINLTDLTGNDKLKKHNLLIKGLDNEIDSYSAFKDSMNNESGLRKTLTNSNITDVYVCGVGKDFCVWWSALDCSSYQYIDNNGKLQHQFDVRLILDASIPVFGRSSRIGMNLPEYNPNGSAPHHKVVKNIGPSQVYADLEKVDLIDNRWVDAFLKPYGVNGATWFESLEYVKQIQSDRVVKNNIVSRPIKKNNDDTKIGNAIFTLLKEQMSVNVNDYDQPEDEFKNSIDLDFIAMISKII
jgi:nicotinamidase-related amidase